MILKNLEMMKKFKIMNTKMKSSKLKTMNNNILMKADKKKILRMMNNNKNSQKMMNVLKTIENKILKMKKTPKKMLNRILKKMGKTMMKKTETMTMMTENII
jgi:hypothetical protein